MKRIFAVFLFLIMFISTQDVLATQLPDNETKLLKQTFSNVKIRFDGLIELSDGTTYIPVFPLQDIPQETLEIKQTIPKNKTLKDKPDFIMFNTNFALFKLIKKGNKTTVVYNNDIPTEIKMGLLPQDLLVPQGFEIPGELRIIIGDLVIPVLPPKDYKEVVITQTQTQTKETQPNTTLVAQAAKQLNNKYFYSSNFKQGAVYILNADNGKAFKKIEFSSIPSDMKLTNNGKYLLVSTIRNGKIFVVDTVKTQVLKEMQAGEKPYQITVSDKDNLAFVANRAGNTITVIDLESMRENDPLTVTGHPTCIALSNNAEKMFYLDSISGTVYSMDKKDSYFEPYSIKPLFRSNNLLKIQTANDKIYTIDRGKNELLVYYTKGKPQSDNMVNVSDIKPISVDTEDTNTKVAADFNYENDEKELNDIKVKKTFKESCNDIVRKVLYYNTPGEAEQNKQTADKITNEVEVLDANVKVSPSDKNPPDPNKIKTAKDHFKDFLNYKTIPEPLTVAETVQLKVEKQMDIVPLPKRPNDFLIIGNKLYLLCSDDYMVVVVDLNTNKKIAEIELPQKGYYNAIKSSIDNTTGMITNISSKELILFDAEKDVVIQKLPLTVDVHNVVITGRK